MTPVIASNISWSQSLNIRKLDGEWQVTLFHIRSEGKLKPSAERTNRQDMSGRLKWILDTHREFMTEAICQTFQSSQFPSCIFSPHKSSVDNNSHLTLMTIRGQLLWLCVLTRRDEAITYHLVLRTRGQKKVGNTAERFWTVAHIRTCFDVCVQRIGLVLSQKLTVCIYVLKGKRLI